MTPRAGLAAARAGSPWLLAAVGGAGRRRGWRAAGAAGARPRPAAFAGGLRRGRSPPRRGRGLPVDRAGPGRLVDLGRRRLPASGPLIGAGLAALSTLVVKGKRMSRPRSLAAILARPRLAGRLAAGPDGPTVVVTQPDESKFPEITVYFEVKRPDGSFILDARRDEFRVTEDGRDRPILRFEAPITTEVRPTTVVLVVDHSGSMTAGATRSAA